MEKLTFLRPIVGILLAITIGFAGIAAKCTDDQLSNFKAGIQIGNSIIQGDKPTIASLVSQGKITPEQGDRWNKFAVDFDAFNSTTQTVKHFPPQNAAELIVQANTLIAEISPIIVNPTTHPILALALGGARGALAYAVTKLGGTTPDLQVPEVPKPLNEYLGDIEKASRQFHELEAG